MSNQERKYDPIPAGEYMVIVDAKGFKGESENSKGTGVNLRMAFKTIGGSHSDRLIFENFCVEHSNPVAVEIANRRLDDYLKAVGFNEGIEGLNGDRTLLENYINKPLLAEVVIEPEKNGFGPNNKIKKFKAL